MTGGLRPYPEYRKSGLPWLPSFPLHWTISRIKTVLRELDWRTPDGVETLLSLTRLRGLIPQTEASNRIHGAKTLVGYKVYHPGQIVMNRMQAWSGMFGTCNLPGIVSPDYAVFQIVGDHNVEFLSYRLKSPDMVGQFALESRGIGSGFNRLYTDRFGSIPITLPPSDEQADIVRFLNHANLQLERAIRAKKKLIALLNEQKQAIIHRAVTRGLDPNVRLKSPSIPWLSDIPEHWKVLPLKRLLRSLIDCEHKTAPVVEESHYRVVRTTAVRNGTLQLRGTYCTTASSYCVWTRRGLPEPGDVIFTREAPAGEACIVPEETQVCLGQRTVLMKPRRTLLNPNFLVHQIYAGPARLAIALATQGSTVGHFNMTDIAVLQMLLPPLPEQETIVNAIKNESAYPDSTIFQAEREIAFIREYRTRLIADVVTGQLDVREAARNLPAEIEEPEATFAPEAEDEAEELLEAVDE
jgi:type I restriction enzyme, S subunit